MKDESINSNSTTKRITVLDLARRYSLRLISIAAIGLVLGIGCTIAPSLPQVTQPSATNLQAVNVQNEISKRKVSSLIKNANKLREIGFYRFKIGAFDAVIFSDGISTVPQDNKFIGTNTTKEAVDRVLKKYLLPQDRLTFDLNVLLVNTGNRLIMVDTGFGSSLPTAGRLLTNLQRAGISPKQITDIVLTHAHPDHIGGIITETGALRFPNARYYISDAEWNWAIASNNDARDRLQLLSSRITRIKPGAEIVPGIGSIPAPGHTPGQIAIVITSMGKQLLYISDTAHHYALSLEHPEWQVGTDANVQLGIQTRRRLLEQAATNRMLVSGYHFPFPGIGYIRPQGKAFVWMPST